MLPTCYNPLPAFCHSQKQGTRATILAFSLVICLSCEQRLTCLSLRYIALHFYRFRESYLDLLLLGDQAYKISLLRIENPLLWDPQHITQHNPSQALSPVKSIEASSSALKKLVCLPSGLNSLGLSLPPYFSPLRISNHGH